MVIDDFGDRGFFDTGDGLGVFVVIDEGETEFRWIDEVRFCDDTDHGIRASFHDGKQVLVDGDEFFADF